MVENSSSLEEESLENRRVIYFIKEFYYYAFFPIIWYLNKAILPEYMLEFLAVIFGLRIIIMESTKIFAESSHKEKLSTTIDHRKQIAEEIIVNITASTSEKNQDINESSQDSSVIIDIDPKEENEKETTSDENIIISTSEKNQAIVESPQQVETTTEIIKSPEVIVMKDKKEQGLSL